MSLYTRIRGLQIKDADITVTQLANDAVETAKIKDKNVTLAKLEDGTEAHIIVVGDDSVPAYKAVSGDVAIDKDGLVTIQADAVQDSMINDDVATGLAGDGLSASSGVMAVDLNELNNPASVNLVLDRIVIIDEDDNSEQITFGVLTPALAGTGLISEANNSLGLKIGEMPAEVIDVANDSFAFTDLNDGLTKTEDIADLITAIAGAGLTATAGVLSADGAADGIVEGDVLKEDETVNCNGSNVEFTLSETPVANSVQVYLNGSLVQEGSGKDYTISGTTITFATAPADDDSLIIHYLKND